MKTEKFPYIALGLGLVLMTLLHLGSKTAPDGYTVLPLLMLLMVSEFAFIVTAIGAYMGVKHWLTSGAQAKNIVLMLACAALSIRFAILGLALWPL